MSPPRIKALSLNSDLFVAANFSNYFDKKRQRIPVSLLAG
jgi:hypothetical protein